MKDTGIIRFDWIDDQMPKDEYSEDERKTMCYAVFMYRNGEGIEPSFEDRSMRTCWRNIKREIDANVKKYEETTEKNRANGAKGGRPKNPQKPNETQNNRSVFGETQQNPQKPNETLYDNEYDNDNEYDLKKEKNKKKKEPKKPFGEFGNVMLTDAEYIKIQERFPLDYDDRIEKLSAYIASTGKKYKDHRATIMNWARRDEERGEKPKGRDRPKRSLHLPDDDIYTDDIYEVL